MEKSNEDQSVRCLLHFRFVELLRGPSPPCCPTQLVSRPIQPGVCVLSRVESRESAPRFRVPPRTCVLESKKGPDPRSALRSTTVPPRLPASTDRPPKVPDNVLAQLRLPGCASNFRPAATPRRPHKSPSGIDADQMHGS